MTIIIRILGGKKKRMSQFDDLLIAYGIIFGAAAGVVIFGITGDIMWLMFSAGIGLVIGLIAGSLFRSHPDAKPRTTP